MKEDDFWTLRQAPLHAFGESEWSSYYERMAPFLRHGDRRIRRNAVERLSMAVMRAEQMSQRRQRLSADRAVSRLGWFLDRLMDAHREHPDIIPAFLEELRHHGDYEPFSRPLCAWLLGLKDRPPPNVRPDVIEGTLILLGEFCRATTHPSTDDLFVIVKTREIARPGIAGAFWSQLQFNNDGAVDVIEWMLEILEERSGPEPNELPFNGVDFYLHELCDGSLGAIERMIKGGHKALALETATETRGVVEGMKDILLGLSSDADEGIAGAAWGHLARYYHCLHPRAAQSPAIQFHAGWVPGVDALVIRQGSGEIFRDVMVLYPESAASPLDERKAWDLIDLALPTAIRGDAAASSMGHKGTGPVRVGSTLAYEFTSGAIVILDGFPDRHAWTRLEIIGQGLQGRWDAGRKPSLG